ncbi:MAG: NifU family protein [Spirochaetales bacterium]|jgi:Fe-S cluster biogenesis protein NfuA|nr:NifU family protein [Bacteroidales bacterium]MBQ3317146.1 NifU family protein [Spirochaetales bacterium]MCR5443716.1 NifU family protein [Sphaerochaetaceae bacterium]MBQ3697114.1 NifU family protein [Spirochaetales bacterium]MBQ3728680.1 NifU family protein [Spirochaetales bacterium]
MDDLEKKVVEAIDYVRPSLQNDGGDIDYVRMEGNKVFVKLRGACAGCMMAEMTLKNGVERMLKYNVSEDLEVVDLTMEDMQKDN